MIPWIKNFARTIYEKIIKINDSPQKIALGVGLGVFLGILPGVGPMAALALAMLLRVNSVAAVTGSLLTNTWISLVTFVLAVKIGSTLMGSDNTAVTEKWKALMADFHWKDIFSPSMLEIAMPVALGFLIVSLALGFTAYLITLAILLLRERRMKANSANFPK